jgi:uncharacterized membrane protein YkvI
MKMKKIIIVVIALIGVFLIGTSVFLIINKDISSHSMPFLLLFNKNNFIIKLVFLIGLVLSLISTAVACLLGVKERINDYKKDEIFINFIVIISSLIIGQMPFKIFIKIVYPIIGIINFILFFLDVFSHKKVTKFLC